MAIKIREFTVSLFYHGGFISGLSTCRMVQQHCTQYWLCYKFYCLALLKDAGSKTVAVADNFLSHIWLSREMGLEWGVFNLTTKLIFYSSQILPIFCSSPKFIQFWKFGFVKRSSFYVEMCVIGLLQRSKDFHKSQCQFWKFDLVKSW
jgi:hypothetical protein